MSGLSGRSVNNDEFFWLILYYRWFMTAASTCVVVARAVFLLADPAPNMYQSMFSSSANSHQILI